MDTATNASLVGAAQMRSTMSQFATGVVVLTVGGDHLHGMTANAFSSVSLEPPMVLCCVGKNAVMHRAITGSGHFAASVLRAGHETYARHFASRDRPLGSAQFAVGDWIPGALTGAPLLTDSLAWVECALADVYEAGDHSVFLGRVIGSGHRSGAGLLFFDGEFHPTTTWPPSTDAGPTDSI
ncbi:flavin reductase [Verrucosispora sp. ts21]|uniref:flavin reductase family protein n=1 Tax=Verrucosispora sp. ts21 TaxID=2069341 RepID=UPI000C88A9A8|nr:flavin reductase family protein [Verrucosispora sp. ts21]PMR62708.1 flavin reductase [Verrucosispora sp. ts21]